jgi:hypothetical protein
VKILNLSLGQDTGGQQMRLARAWRRYFPADTYSSVTSTHTFYEIENKLDKAWVANDLWPNADLIHQNNDLNFAVSRFPKRSLDLYKPMVIHHHGTMYRTRPDYHLAAQEKYQATSLCSTVDLWAIAPDKSQWLPQAYEPEELMDYRNRFYDPKDGVLRIAHAPTNRVIKSTRALENAVKKLKWLGAKVQLDVIEKVSNQKCLERKAQADVFVDQLLLGYGCNAIEAWGMGIPVIAGVQPDQCVPMIRQAIPADTLDRMHQQWGTIPFPMTTEATLVTELGKMLDPEYRALWSDIGSKHFHRHHNAEVVVTNLRGIYLDTITRHRDRTRDSDQSAA